MSWMDSPEGVGREVTGLVRVVGAGGGVTGKTRPVPRLVPKKKKIDKNAQ